MSKIETLKKEARKYYNQYNKILDNNKFSCGIALSEYISPELEILRKKFNETLDELSLIDPSCPTKRL